jgi:hypothetical protein
LFNTTIELKPCCCGGPCPERSRRNTADTKHPLFRCRIRSFDANDSFLWAKAKLSPSKRIVLAAYRMPVIELVKNPLSRWGEGKPPFSQAVLFISQCSLLASLHFASVTSKYAKLTYFVSRSCSLSRIRS